MQTSESNVSNFSTSLPSNLYITHPCCNLFCLPDDAKRWNLKAWGTYRSVITLIQCIGPFSRESSLLKCITHKNLNHRIHSICWLPTSESEDSGAEFTNLQMSFRWHFFLKPMENYSFDLQKAKCIHLLCYCRVEETITLFSMLHL